MNCDEVEARLPFLQDGSLDLDTAREVRRHLDGCDECTRKYAHLASVVELARSALQDRKLLTGPGYIETVRKRIEKERHTYSFHRWTVPAAAAVFLALSLTTYQIFLDGGANRNGLRSASSSTELKAASNTANQSPDTAVINAMYHYSDVTLDDFMSRLDKSELAAALDAEGR